MRNIKKTLSLLLCVTMLLGFTVSFASANETDISALPEAVFVVDGTTMDRGFFAAKIANGVFLSWRYFPEEATGYTATGLAGADFAVFKNGVKLADVTDSTDYLDATGTVNDKYIVVTVVGGVYTSRTAEATPAAQTSNGNYLRIPVQQPPKATGLNTGDYYMDEMSAGDVDGDGKIEIVLKWETGSPDVITQGYQAPVIYDCYEMDGTRLWRIDMGVNVRAGQHYLQPMLYDFDGDGKAEFMIQTAPGTKDGLGNYITMPETVHTDWNGNKNWSHTADYRNNDGNTTAANRLSDNTTVMWMKNFFLNWQNHPEVKHAYYGADNEFDAYAERGGFGWWKYPPQVMLGMYPAGYVGENGAIEAAGRWWDAFSANSNATQWTQERWDVLKAMPTDPAAFKSHVMTEAEAEALALLWYVNNYLDAGGRDRFRGSGHIIDGPEFFTVFEGATGKELDTIPFAVPRGIINPDGSYTPDVGIMWNDFTGGWDEPYNRVERHLGAVAYLDGKGKNASCIQVRGYYSRTTVTRYDWDGVNLTSEVITDSGFEVSLNPFANNVSVVGGAVARGNTHGGPGRYEVCFNPAAPLTEKPEMIATVDLANKYGSITCQGYHSPSVMDVNGDGFDEFIIGNACFNSDGSVRWAGYYQPYVIGTDETVPSGNITKLGHGDSLHVGYFDPDQETPKMWGCLEGAWADEVLRDADTGEVQYFMGAFGRTGYPGNTLTTWGNQGDNGRAMVGKFTTEPGWQLSTRGRGPSPLGANTAWGLRKSDGTPSASQSYTPGNAASIYWSPTLYTQTCSNSIAAAYVGGGTALSTSGTRVSGGTKNQPGYVADFMGDFREELILSTSANNEIRIYFNTEESTHKLATLLADRRYRCEIERQKTCYNQPSYTGFYYGADMNWEIYFNSINTAASVDSFTVSPITYVAGLAANIRYNISGKNLDGAVLSLEFGDEYFHAEAPTGIVHIDTMPAAGTYPVKLWLGNDVVKSFDITVVPYNTNIWEPVVIETESGAAAVLFADTIGTKAGYTATLNGAPVTVTQDGTDRLVLGVAYASLAKGDKIVIKGVKYPVLFPSYSFTFTIVK